MEMQQLTSKQAVTKTNGSNKWDQNVINDINAPDFFSQKTRQQIESIHLK